MVNNFFTLLINTLHLSHIFQSLSVIKHCVCPRVKHQSHIQFHEYLLLFHQHQSGLGPKDSSPLPPVGSRARMGRDVVFLWVYTSPSLSLVSHWSLRYMGEPGESIGEAAFLYVWRGEGSLVLQWLSLVLSR